MHILLIHIELPMVKLFPVPIERTQEPREPLGKKPQILKNTENLQGQLSS